MILIDGTYKNKKVREAAPEPAPVAKRDDYGNYGDCKSLNPIHFIGFIFKSIYSLESWIYDHEMLTQPPVDGDYGNCSYIGSYSNTLLTP